MPSLRVWLAAARVSKATRPRRRRNGVKRTRAATRARCHSPRLESESLAAARRHLPAAACLTVLAAARVSSLGPPRSPLPESLAAARVTCRRGPSHWHSPACRHLPLTGRLPVMVVPAPSHSGSPVLARRLSPFKFKLPEFHKSLRRHGPPRRNGPPDSLESSAAAQLENHLALAAARV